MIFLGKWLERIKGELAQRTRSEVPLEGDRSGRFENQLHKYAGLHENQRCFIVGNGPSLNRIDMSLVKDEITLGANRVYLGFEKWGFHFTYWGVEDFLQIKQGHKEFNRFLPDDMVKFVPRQYCHLFRVKNLCPVNFLYEYGGYPKFSGGPDVLYLGYSVTYMLLQIAVVMGCDPIYLIGVDYSYNIPDQVRVGEKWSDPNSRSHFTSDYCDADEGRVWNIPQFDKTDAAFECAANWARAEGVEILNATPGSMLESLPKVAFESLFRVS